MWALNTWAILNVVTTVFLLVMVNITCNPWAVLLYPGIDDILIDCLKINSYGWRNTIKVLFTIVFFPAVVAYAIIQTAIVMIFVLMLCISTIFTKERYR